MVGNSYEDLRDHVAACKGMAEAYEKHARSFSARLCGSRNEALERAAYWREKERFWDDRIKASFEAGEAWIQSEAGKRR